MAPKDYVKRTQAKPRKRPAKKNAKQATPWLRILVACALVLAFVFALYKLQQVDVDNKPIAETENTPLADTIIADDSLEKEALPELPVLEEEDWEYIDSLPEFSVEVDATGPLTSNKDFIMQCGSFRTIERAQELRAKVAFQGLESRILTSDGSNGLWYRVVLGPYQRKREAESHRHQLRNANINGCKIW